MKKRYARPRGLEIAISEKLGFVENPVTLKFFSELFQPNHWIDPSILDRMRYLAHFYDVVSKCHRKYDTDRKFGIKANEFIFVMLNSL